MKTFSLFVLLSLGALVAQAQAGHHGNCCCNSCGCSNVKKVCRLVCGTTTVTTFCYDVKCEDFCLPGKSEKCGTRCVPDCNAHHGCRKEIVWIPHCSCHVRTRKTLVKTPVTREVPTYTCVVECICCGCGCGCGSMPATDAQQQAAIEQAKSQGILPTVAEEEVVVPLAEETAEAEPAKKSASLIGAFFGK